MKRIFSGAALTAACACGSVLSAGADGATIAYWRFEAGTGQTTAATEGVTQIMSNSLLLGGATGVSAVADPAWVIGGGRGGSNCLEFTHTTSPDQRTRLTWNHASDASTTEPDDALVQSGSFTVEAFIQPKAVLPSAATWNMSEGGPRYETIVTLTGENNNSPSNRLLTNFSLRIVDGGDGKNYLQAMYTNSDRSNVVEYTVTNTTEITVGSWYYVAMRYDTTTNKLEAIVNDSIASASGLASDPTTFTGTTGNKGAMFSIGGTMTGVTNPRDATMFNGRIDDVRISDVALANSALLDPVPEPTSAGLVTMTGIALVAGGRRCRRARS